MMKMDVEVLLETLRDKCHVYQTDFPPCTARLFASRTSVSKDVGEDEQGTNDAHPPCCQPVVADTQVRHACRWAMSLHLLLLKLGLLIIGLSIQR